MNDSTMPAESPQIERLVDIGARLRERRESQGLTIESVAATTKIQRRILQALEAADSSALPEPIYVRGFIAKYAAALGLNGSELAQEYPLQNGLVPVRSQRVLSVIPAPQLKPAHLVILYIGVLMASVLGLSALLRQRTPPATVVVPLPTSSPSVSPTPSNTVSPRPSVSPSVAASPSPIASPSASPTPSASPSPTPTASPSPTPSASPSPKPTPSPSASPSPTPTPSATATPKPSPIASPTPKPSPARATASPTAIPARSPAAPTTANGGNGLLVAQGIASSIRFPQNLPLRAMSLAPVRVNLRLSERSWVRITTDGKVTYEGVLPQGTQRLITGQRNVVVVTGNAGGTFLSYNEGTERKVGNPGAVQAARFAAPGANGGATAPRPPASRNPAVGNTRPANPRT